MGENLILIIFLEYAQIIHKHEDLNLTKPEELWNYVTTLKAPITDIKVGFHWFYKQNIAGTVFIFMFYRLQSYAEND